MIDIILDILILVGIAGLFRPILLIFLFAALPVVEAIPTIDMAQNQFKILTLGTLDLYYVDFLILMMAITLGVYLFKRIVSKEPIELLTDNIAKAVFAIFIWEAFIGILSYSKGFALQNILRQLANEAIGFVAIVVLLAGSGKKRDVFFKALLLNGLVLVAFAAVRYFVTNEVELTSSGTIRTIHGKSVLVLLLPICYLLYHKRKIFNSSALTIICLLILVSGIGFAGHRSGWIALLFVLSGYVAVNRRRMMAYLWAPMLCLCVVLTVVLILPPSKVSGGKSLVSDSVLRIYDTFDPKNATTQERVSKWMQSLEVLAEKPLLGLGRYPVYTQFIDESNLKLEKFDELNLATHNLFMTKIIHEGLLGFLVLAGFFFYVFRKTKLTDSSNTHYRFLRYYLYAFVIFSLFNETFSEPSIKGYFFFALGFLNATVNEASVEGLSKVAVKPFKRLTSAVGAVGT